MAAICPEKKLNLTSKKVRKVGSQRIVAAQNSNWAEQFQLSDHSSSIIEF